MNRFISAMLASLLTTLAVRAQAADARPQAVTMQAFAFDSDTGELQETDVFGTGSSFLNEMTLDALLIVVEIAGSAGARYVAPKDRKYNVQLTGTSLESGKRLFKLSRPLRWMSSEGKRYVSFLVYDVQCEGATVVANVVGPGASKPLEATASFRCGE